MKYLKYTSAGQKLTAIILLYLILATAYSIVVPIGRGADEWAHYWYAQFIAQNGRLPLTVAEREAAGYKSDWPPLYHLFAAGLTAWVETDGPPTLKYRQDNIRRQLVPAQGPEAILHTEDERFPWQQEILIWHLGRFLSIVFTTGVLLVTYAIAREVFASNQGAEAQRSRGAREQGSGGARELESPNLPISQSLITNYQLPITTLALLAFNPRFLFTGMLFNYDSLTLLLSSLFLWVAIRIVKGYTSPWNFWGLGALAGLALVTKYLAAPLVLVIVILAFYRGAGEPGSKGTALRQAQEPEQGSGGAREQRSKGAGERGGVSAPRTTHHASRITHHASCILPKPLLQATLAFLLVASWWFAYLIITFNEIDTYGPVLGTLAPLIRGDGSDRTVEQLFAWLSGGQAPPPAYIEKQSYTAWQILTELPTTFWGNPIVRPYPLNWFIVVMTLITIIALTGVGMAWRRLPLLSEAKRILMLLLLYCLLPTPFMVIRLFGARDALEAVQGRHILFLAGPAVAILLVLGLREVVTRLGDGGERGSRGAGERGSRGARAQGRKTIHKPVLSQVEGTQYAIRFTFYVLLALLLTGALSQLIFMRQTYPPLLPLRTTPFSEPINVSQDIVFEGGARLLGYDLDREGEALKVTFSWQGGAYPSPEDYQWELALVDPQGQTWSSWLGYQTQARYPTRAWEAGDIIRDQGWLPLVGAPAGDYQIRWRLWGQSGEVIPWQSLASYNLDQPAPPLTSETGLTLWRNGQVAAFSPLFQERQTIQLTISQSPNLPISSPHLLDPDHHPRPPTTSGPTWANFIIGPDWPPGDYFLAGATGTAPLLRLADNGRNFARPEIWQPLDANFAGKIKLLGYNLPSRRVEPGEGLPLTLFWQGLEWLGQEFVIFTRLLDNQGLAWGGYDRLAQENYSTLLWAPGEIITDGFAVPVAPDAPAGVYTLSVGWYRRVEGQAVSLPLVDLETGQPTEITSVTIGPIKVDGPPEGVTVPQATPQIGMNVILGDKIKLTGADITQNGQPITAEALSNQAALELTLYWQTLEAMDTDYTIFVHVRNGLGATVAQKDDLPARGTYPTSLWDAGEIIRDQVSVPLDQLPPGQYEVVVGLYNFATGQRLPVVNSSDDTILLRWIEVGPE